MTPAREVALQLLRAVDRGRRLDRAWEEAAPELPSGERGWVQEAVYGTLRLRGRLDHLLELHLRQGLESLSGPLLPIFRLAAYQLLEMDSVPDYAAVSQAVDQARAAAGAGGARLANGVLRSLSRKGGGVERFPDFASDPVGHLSTWGSHPRWLVERWVTRYGADGARSIVEAGNRIPPLYLRPIGVSPAEAGERLDAVGIGWEAAPHGSPSLRLAPGSAPMRALDAVPAVVQDPAAGWVVEAVGPVEDRLVADLCAAPGGKGIALAGLGARLIAADPSLPRLRRLRANLRRLGLPERLVCARGEAPPLVGADVVLVDVPCSGTGTLARHPDARWRLAPGDIAMLAELQDGILEGAAGAVAVSGMLVYSTCSLEPEENDDRIEAFLRRHPEFIVEAVTGPPHGFMDGDMLRVLPRAGEFDGAFAARLRRMK